MSEDFLHFVWQYQLYSLGDSHPTIQVLHPGYHNTHEGPDFLHSKIVIDGIEWNGHVEVHIRSSDWDKHKHEANFHYRNVILHVVLDEDKKINLTCPTIALNGKIKSNIQDQYLEWLHNSHDIPCAFSGLKDINSIHRTQWIDRLIIDRCDTKYLEWLDVYHQVKNNWRQMIWVKVAESFGMKYNGVSFRHLAMNIDIATLDKLKDNTEQLEAFLFGVSGLIPADCNDEYSNRLKKEFSYIRNRYPLHDPIIKMPWKFLRMRPANFPTIRVAQLAKLLSTISQFPQNLMAKQLSLRSLEKALDVEVSEYWESHYLFGKEAKKTPKKLGITAVRNIIINAVIPLHYFHGKIFNDNTSVSYAFHLLQSLPAEHNSVIDKWTIHQHIPKSAYESQSYIHLYNNFCIKKKCATCHFGKKILMN